MRLAFSPLSRQHPLRGGLIRLVLREKRRAGEQLLHSYLSERIVNFERKAVREELERKGIAPCVIGEENLPQGLRKEMGAQRVA